MKNEANDVVRSPEAPRLRRPARWNVIAVVAPLIGFACALCLYPDPRYGYQSVQVTLSLWGFGVLGCLSGIMAIARRERLWGVTALGLALSGSVTAFGLSLIR